MKILGFNPAHHGSVCLLEDGELKFFIQEERIGSREKYASYPFGSFIDILQNHKIDIISWGTPSIIYPESSCSDIPYWYRIANYHHPSSLYKDFSPDSHHRCHIAHSFYNSGFEKCIGIVIDGAGSSIADQNQRNIGQETETIYECSYPNNFEVLTKNLFYFDKGNINLSQIYETITMHLGWSNNEAGKTMGLAPYGNYNPDLPNFFNQNIGNSNVFFRDNNHRTSNPKQFETFIDDIQNPQLKLPSDPREWHYDKSKITNLEKDLAWKIQNDTQQLVGDYIEKAIQKTNLKQVCCGGGYFLNCVTNYYLLKRFPGIEFYFEPIANDAGIAIGSAKLLWHARTQDSTIRPFKSLYLGKQYSKEELLEGIKKYINKK
jgi:carbamoyltransferase